MALTVPIAQQHGGAGKPIVRMAASAEEHDAARRLFRDYEKSLDVDLSAQAFDAEIAGLPGQYAPPQGALLLAHWAGGPLHGHALGCVAVRAFRPGACELKRLYVYPAGRGTGAGRMLMAQALAFAQSSGYREMLLDSLPGMQAAISLYRSCGFAEIEPYWNNIFPGALYFGKTLLPRR